MVITSTVHIVHNPNLNIESNIMSNQELNQNVSMDDLLDGTLDDLADMPEFKPFAPGAHKLKLNFTQKTINEAPSIELKLTVIESVELSNPDDTPPAVGDTTNVLFKMKTKGDDGKLVRNEMAEAQFKKLLTDLAPAFPEAKSNRDIMTAAEGYEVLGVTGIWENKRDKNNIKRYTTLDSVAII